ncbi:MAG TPA: acyl-CoA-binding protein [Polyangiaceae bacterium]|nr:acyl-CoA-binding protein [Polyangiaceae bacterium]
MSLSEDFATAQVRVKQLSRAPEASELLELYALYKQGTLGDVSGERPGMLDFKGRAKYDSWQGKKGTSKDSAMQSYVALVEKLAKKYG